LVFGLVFWSQIQLRFESGLVFSPNVWTILGLKFSFGAAAAKFFLDANKWLKLKSSFITSHRKSILFSRQNFGIFALCPIPVAARNRQRYLDFGT